MAGEEIFSVVYHQKNPRTIRIPGGTDFVKICLSGRSIHENDAHIVKGGSLVGWFGNSLRSDRVAS